MRLFMKLLGVVARELCFFASLFLPHRSSSLEKTKKEAFGKKTIKSPESSKSSTPRRNNGDIVRKQTTVKKTGQPKKTRATVKSTNEQDSGKKLWWIDHLTLLYNGEKYALRYKYERKSEATEYIYDDVEVLNRVQARLTQKKQDGSIRYGVVVSNGLKFFVTECDYTKVTYLDGVMAVMAIDEDGDEYAIENYGQIYSIEKYREHVQERNSCEE